MVSLRAATAVKAPITVFHVAGGFWFPGLEKARAYRATGVFRPYSDATLSPGVSQKVAKVWPIFGQRAVTFPASP